MPEKTPLDPTVDIVPSGDDVGAGAEPQLPAGGSVLEALCDALPSVPRILLREPESFGGSPIVRPSSEEMPDKQEPGARLQLHGEIARGGMGAVLKGRDVDLGRDVAVKVLLETHQGKTEMLQRFVEEAQISGQLQHPGIAPVYEFGQFADKRPYFTMKLVKGKTLASLLAERGDKRPACPPVTSATSEPFVATDLPRFLGIFAQICQTLAYAHARGVIHRDLKPSNVMVGAFGEVQVMDWGLAKVRKEGGIADEQKAQERSEISVIRTQRSEGSAAPDVGSQTQAGTVLGTPAYMAPEQARGEVELVDERADVFGLEAILCEILTGRPPYVGKGAEIAYKARAAKLEDALARLNACGADAELIALTRRCLAAELWERPRDAGVVAEQMTNYQNSVTERLRQAELARAAEEARAIEARATAAQERRARRMTLALAATVLFAALLGGGGGLWLHNQRATRLAENNHAIKEALNQATSLREQARTAQRRAALDLAARAREQARRAEALVESGPADEALRAQLRGLLTALDADEKDRQLLADLDAARLAQIITNQIVTNQTNRGNIRFVFPDLRGPGFKMQQAVPLFREAFRAYGMPAGEKEIAEVAARLRECPEDVRQAVVAALDEWIALVENPRWKIKEPHLAWLRELVAAADPEGWGKRVRDAVAENDGRIRQVMLKELAESADVKRLSPRAITQLADRLFDSVSFDFDPLNGDMMALQDAAMSLLRRAQVQYPSDFWINVKLGIGGEKRGIGGGFMDPVTMAPLNPDDSQRPPATRYLAAAVALRPDSAVAHLNLAHALGVSEEEKSDDTIAEYRKAIELEPTLAAAHFGLAMALESRLKSEEARTAFLKAVKLDNSFARPALAWPILSFSLDTLHAVGKLDEYIAIWREAIELNPNAPWPHVYLGASLRHQEKLNDAITEYRKAIQLDPKNAYAHHSLGEALQEQGDLGSAIAEYRKSIELEPNDLVSYINIEEILRNQGKVDAATAILREAIERNPSNSGFSVANILRKRNIAACSAALAGCGRGKDAINLDDKKRASLRRQALDWLRADLPIYAQFLKYGDQVFVKEQLSKLRQEKDLAGIRDAKELAKLPAEERQACEKLWADVAALLAKTQPRK